MPGTVPRSTVQIAAIFPGRVQPLPSACSFVALLRVFEQRADAKNGFPHAVWFRQEGGCHVSGTSGLSVAGSEDDMNAGVMLRNPAGETDSIHRVGASHKIDVAEDKINDRSRGEDGNSFRRISCFDDIVASYPQKLGSDTAHKDFVFDNQDDVVPVFPPRCCLWAHDPEDLRKTPHYYPDPATTLVTYWFL
jgi:hypothetical protein